MDDFDTILFQIYYVIRLPIITAIEEDLRKLLRK